MKYGAEHGPWKVFFAVKFPELEWLTHLTEVNIYKLGITITEVF